MTLPYEEIRAVEQTREFLLSLRRPDETPRVPKRIREIAHLLLRHYPWTGRVRDAYRKSGIEV